MCFVRLESCIALTEFVKHNFTIESGICATFVNMMTGTLTSLYSRGMGANCPWLYLGKGWSNDVPTFMIRHPTNLERLELAMN
jgi:hypothetical protein